MAVPIQDPGAPRGRPADATTIDRSVLSDSFFLGELGADELDEFLQFAVLQRFEADETIFSKGDPGDSFCAILNGRVAITTVSEDGREVLLNILDSGQVFGEIAVLDGKSVSPEEIRRFGAWLPAGRTDQKKEDAVLMLRTMKQHQGQARGFEPPPFHFEHTSLWDRPRTLDPGRGRRGGKRQALNQPQRGIGRARMGGASDSELRAAIVPILSADSS